MKSPLDLLLPFQRAWVDDDSRFKVWNASRQIGKSFTSACEAVRDCELNPGTLWVVLSAGERQSLEWMEKAKQWVKAFAMAMTYMEEREHPEALMKSAEIRFANGSRIIALPANPDTARGYSANLILDEFAIHKDSAAIWQAMYPSITNPLKRQLKVRVMSTPKGEGNMFHRIWNEPGWSKHRTTIFDAIAGGLALDAEELRSKAADNDTWLQEFCCEFIDSARTAFSYEMLGAAECEDASLVWPDGYQPKGPLYVGIDVGSIHDPTVCVTFEKLGGRMHLRERLVIQGVELSQQDNLLDAAIRRAARVGIDASGIGLDLSQRLQRKHGGKITKQVTTAPWKRQAFARLQHRFNDKAIALPPSRELREDFHAYEVSGAGEQARYRAPRTEDGHSDTASATAHAFDVAEASNGEAFTTDTVSQTIIQPVTTISRPRFIPRRR
jgi:phage FluMu gp28-like protein